jgi:hypothetical protein
LGARKSEWGGRRKRQKADAGSRSEGNGVIRRRKIVWSWTKRESEAE